MEMLNINMLLAGNFWTNIINFFANWLVNYGWAIIVFTICLKLVLTPLDIGQRIATSKQSKVMAYMQPEMDALQAKYGNNKEKLNQEQAKLYKKYKVNLGGMCGIMLISMIVSLVVVFTLYGSLRAYGDEKLHTSFHKIDEAYVQVEKGFDEGLTDEEKNKALTEVVLDTYNKNSKQNSWLWVKNVWKPDTNTSQFVDFESYAKAYKLTGTEKELAKVRYEFITSTINKQTGENNGYYILIIMAVVVSFLTQFVSAKLLSPKGQKLNMTNKIMMAIIPFTMVVLVTTSNVVYTLYVIVNSLVTALISTIISLILRNNSKKNKNSGDILLSKKKVQVVEYSRNYKK